MKERERKKERKKRNKKEKLAPFKGRGVWGEVFTSWGSSKQVCGMGTMGGWSVPGPPLPPSPGLQVISCNEFINMHCDAPSKYMQATRPVLEGKGEQQRGWGKILQSCLPRVYSLAEIQASGNSKWESEGCHLAKHYQINPWGLGGGNAVRPEGGVRGEKWRGLGENVKHLEGEAHLSWVLNDEGQVKIAF